MLFKYLVRSIMGYGVEIWGWEEKEQLEKVMMDYVRWLFRLDFCTPRYLISRELRMDRLSLGWGIRAVRFEGKIRNSMKRGLLQRCWKEKELSKEEDRYGRERRLYYNKLSWELEEIDIAWNNDENLEEKIIFREQERQRVLEVMKVNEANYNKRYKVMDTKDNGPRYLHKDNLDDTIKGGGS